MMMKAAYILRLHFLSISDYSSQKSMQNIIL